MPPKNKPHTWNDVQTAITTVTIVTTLGMWNLFATPAPKKVTQTAADQSPAEEPPIPSYTSSTPTPVPQFKIFFTEQTVSQSVAPQQEQTVTHKKKNKNKNNNNGGGGGGTVTTTKTS